MSVLEYLWNYKIQILPIVLFFLIYEAPSFIRRLKKTFYVPIYFSIYPFRRINQDLSIYLADDDFFGFGQDLEESKAEALRKKIMITSIVSGALDALIIPLVVGFIAAAWLSKEIFYQFMVMLIIYKVIAIVFSLYNNHFREILGGWKMPLLFLIYFFYIGLVFEMMRTSYEWASPFMDKSDFIGLFFSFSELFFGKILAQGVVFVVIIAIFSDLIADRKLRRRNLSNDE